MNKVFNKLLMISFIQTSEEKAENYSHKLKVNFSEKLSNIIEMKMTRRKLLVSRKLAFSFDILNWVMKSYKNVIT